MTKKILKKNYNTFRDEYVTDKNAKSVVIWVRTKKNELFSGKDKIGKP